ncbi:MFS transporter, partial [Pseudomonas fluorescens]|uniref:MFS transporter n=1 Tax=Pseudomonas fluorescens TaxID=294 RepID=UPI000F479987
DGAIRTLHQRLIMEYFEPAQRSRAQALSRVARNLGMAAAGVAGGVLAQTDFRWVFFVSAAMTLLALLWVVRTTWRRAVLEPDEVTAAGTGTPWRDTA